MRIPHTTSLFVSLYVLRPCNTRPEPALASTVAGGILKPFQEANKMALLRGGKPHTQFVAQRILCFVAFFILFTDAPETFG